jgi:hypothetical protein
MAMLAAACFENPAVYKPDQERDSTEGDLPVNFNLEYAPHDHEHSRSDHKKPDPRGPLFQQHLQRLIRKVQRHVYRLLFRSIPNRGAKEVDLSKLRNNQDHSKKR